MNFIITIFADVSGTVKILLDYVFNLVDLILFLKNFFFLLLHFLSVGLHELHELRDHLMKLDDFLFHTIVE